MLGLKKNGRKFECFPFKNKWERIKNDKIINLFKNNKNEEIKRICYLILQYLKETK